MIKVPLYILIYPTPNIAPVAHYIATNPHVPLSQHSVVPVDPMFSWRQWQPHNEQLRELSKVNKVLKQLLTEDRF